MAGNAAKAIGWPENERFRRVTPVTGLLKVTVIVSVPGTKASVAIGRTVSMVSRILPPACWDPNTFSTFVDTVFTPSDMAGSFSVQRPLAGTTTHPTDVLLTDTVTKLPAEPRPTTVGVESLVVKSPFTPVSE